MSLTLIPSALTFSSTNTPCAAAPTALAEPKCSCPPPEPKYKVGVVTHGSKTSSFWAAWVEGAHTAAQESEAELSVHQVGYDPAAAVEALGKCATEGWHALVVSVPYAFNSSGYIAVDKAVRACGIPVVSTNSDSYINDDALGYVGALSYDTGLACANAAIYGAAGLPVSQVELIAVGKARQPKGRELATTGATAYDFTIVAEEGYTPEKNAPVAAREAGVRDWLDRYRWPKNVKHGILTTVPTVLGAAGLQSLGDNANASAILLSVNLFDPNAATPQLICGDVEAEVPAPMVGQLVRRQGLSAVSLAINALKPPATSNARVSNLFGTSAVTNDMAVHL